MQMVAGQDDHFRSIDDVENPVGKAAHDGAARVSFHSLVQRWIEAEMLLHSENLIEKLDAEPVAFVLAIAEDCPDLSRGSRRVGNARHAAFKNRSACGGFRPR